VENGLSENFVRCIFQDSKGYLWIGTDDGLNKFDGYSFKIFRYEPGNPNSLSDYAINAIVEDKNGILWIATREGLNRFDPQTETFKIFRHNPDDKNSLCNNFIFSLYADSRNNLWIGTRSGLNLLDLMYRHVQHLWERLHWRSGLGSKIFPKALQFQCP